jgi:hypothetical protein
MHKFVRAGHPKKKKNVADLKSHKTRNRESTKCGCGMKVEFFPEGDAEENEEQEYMVVSASFEHTNGCRPGEAQQRILQRVSTSNKVPVQVLQALVEAMRTHPSTKQIRKFLATYKIKLPANDAQSICNLKLAVARHLRQGKLVTQELDLEDDRYLDDLGALFQAEFKRNVDEQSASEIVSLLEYLRGEIEGFDYRVQVERQGDKKVVRSLIWQTGRMRARLRIILRWQGGH